MESTASPVLTSSTAAQSPTPSTTQSPTTQSTTQHVLAIAAGAATIGATAATSSPQHHSVSIFERLMHWLETSGAQIAVAEAVKALPQGSAPPA